MTLTIYKTFSRVCHSYLAVVEMASAEGDPKIFVVKDEAFSSSSESSTESSSADSSDTSAEPATGPVYANRVLVSVASPTDMQVYTDTAVPPSRLYRAAVVLLLFRSAAHMDTVIARVITQAKTAVRLQGLPVLNVDVVTVTDPLSGKSTDKAFKFGSPHA